MEVTYADVTKVVKLQFCISIETFLGYEDFNSNCRDVDECAADPCSSGAKCHNTDGSYSCVCEDGFQLQPDKSCTDIDECRFERKS